LPHQILPLWTVAADDVAGRANTPEEVHTDGGRGGSRGNIGQVHIHTDFFSRGRLRACGRQRREEKLLPNAPDTKTQIVEILRKIKFHISYLDKVQILLVLSECWRRVFE